MMYHPTKHMKTISNIREITTKELSKPAKRHPTERFVWAVGVAGIITVGHTSVLAASDGSSPPLDLQKTETNFWNQKYMFGDWGGERSRLAEKGITFDVNNIGDFQTDVSGSQTHHAIYFGRLRASSDVDFNQLCGFDGEFFISGAYQYGENLSGQYLHVNTLTSSIAGVDSHRLDILWYQQGLFNHLLTLKVGQIAAVNEFGATDFFDLFFNDELGYAPNALFNTKQPFSPAGKPGAVVWGDLSTVTPGLYVKAGVFTAYENPYRPDRYGVDYNDDFDHGVVASFESGYQQQHTQYSGVFKLGINVNDLAVYSNPATGEKYRGDFTAYGIAEKAVFHPQGHDGKLELDKGLDMVVEVLGAPGDRNPLAYEFTMGGRYTGLIPGRDHDKVGFGLIYSQNGSAYSDAYAAVNGHGLGGETTLELDYQFNPMPWFSFQIDDQFIIDPGGDSHRSEIDVIGLRTIFRF
jgi:porin